MMRWHDCAVLATAVFLVGCVAPSTYRVEAGRIFLPHTRTITESGQAMTAIDVAAALPRGDSCGRPIATPSLSARRIELYADRRITRAVRFFGPEASFASADALIGHFNTWADAQPAPCRLPSDARAMMLRNLLAQRPLHVREAIEAWYGTGEGDDAARAIVLRPGMRLCVSDVTSTDVNSIRYALSGETCARLVQGPRGAVLDTIASRFTVPVISSDGSPPKDAARTVRSWSEIENPSWVRRSFIVVLPMNMPTLPSESDIGYYSLLIIADPDSEIRVIPTEGGSRTYPTVAGVLAASRTAEQITNVCRNSADQLRCIRFGERGVYRVDLPITLNGSAMDVPVGTTLAGVVGMVAPDFAGSYLTGPAPLQEDEVARDRRQRSYAKLELHRWFDGRRVRVELPAEPGEMPLQPGDRITW